MAYEAGKDAPDPKIAVARLSALASSVVYSEEAYRTIVDETSRFQGLETGGLLLGKRRPNGLFIVIKASIAGPQATHYPDGYRKDTDYDKAILKQAREAGLELLGTWHTHPSHRGVRVPSTQDVLAAFGTMHESNLHSCIELIVQQKGTVVTLFPWLIPDAQSTQFLDHPTFSTRPLNIWLRSLKRTPTVGGHPPLINFVGNLDGYSEQLRRV